MQIKYFGRLAISGFVAFIAALIMAGPASAAWSVPANVATENGSNSFGVSLPVVAMDDGSSASSWYEFNGATTSLMTRRVNREGAAAATATTVVSISDPPGGSAWITQADATGVGTSTLFAWVERTYVSTPVPTYSWALKTRAVDSNGNGGVTNTVASGNLPTTSGTDSVRSFSLASNGNNAAVAWSMRQSRGPDCGNYYSGNDCVVTAVANGVALSNTGAATSGIVPIVNEVTECGSSSQRSTVEVGSDGVATAVVAFCKYQASDSGYKVVFQRFGSSGAVGGPGFLTWVDNGLSLTSGIDSSNQVNVGLNYRVYRIKSDGSVVPPVIVADSGQNDQTIDGIAVQPDGTATATWVSYQAGGTNGNGLDYTVWTRQLESDGTLSDRNSITTAKVDRPVDGYVYFSFYPMIATGQGTETGTIGVNSYQETYSGPPAFSYVSQSSFLAGELNADSALSSSQQLASGNVGGNGIGVSADGTGVAEWSSSTGSPSYIDSINVSKLPRDTTKCGVIPSNCKAVLKVNSLSPSKGKINAGKKLSVKIKVTNNGDADATGVSATVKSNNKKVTVPKKVNFGDIAIGASVTKTIKVSAKGSAKGKAKITVKAGSSSKSATYTVKAKKKKKKKGKK